MHPPGQGCVLPLSPAAVAVLNICLAWKSHWNHWKGSHHLIGLMPSGESRAAGEGGEGLREINGCIVTASLPAVLLSATSFIRHWLTFLKQRLRKTFSQKLLSENLCIQIKRCQLYIYIYIYILVCIEKVRGFCSFVCFLLSLICLHSFSSNK